MNRRGILPINPQPKDARIADLFMGDELTNHNYVDISKVQLFFFTLAAISGYFYTLWRYSWPQDGAIVFPDFSVSLVTLLGISHTGYLTVKAAPKTPTT